MDGAGNSLLQLIASAQNYVYIIVAVALLVIGVMFIIPNQKCKEAAKAAIPFVGIGAAIALGATVFAVEFCSKMAF